MTVEKIAWPTYFMNVAAAVSLKSSCLRRQVGAIIVKDRRIISTGYNGTPRGTVNCDEGGCARCADQSIGSGTSLNECLCCHAEENAIVQAAYHGVSIKGAELYTTLFPCKACAKMSINAGISAIYYHRPYHNFNEVKSFLNSVNVSLELVDQLIQVTPISTIARK